MHIDLNSAFAMAEQQANPLLRGKPIGITNRLNDWAICIAASHEAKQRGIGIGTRWREARLIAPGFVMIESDPDKYRYIHLKLRDILTSYSPDAYMKSVDEGIIDFTHMHRLTSGRSLPAIAMEIKQRIKAEIGDYMTVNIGIAQNRWLAKVAAGFNKPDGLLTIRPGEQEALLATMQLTDLPYIKRRNQQRLNQAGIHTPLELYHTPYWVLFRRVFKGVLGHHWYLKLRGYETEVRHGIKTIGRNYVLEDRTNDPEIISHLLHRASVKVSRRLLQKGFVARGLMLSLRYQQNRSTEYSKYCAHRWFHRQVWAAAAYRADQLFKRSIELFGLSPPGQVVVGFDLTSYALMPRTAHQPTLFEDDHQCHERLEDAINAVNNRYGELKIAPANVVLRSKNPMKDKVPFGTVRYFE